MKRFPLILAVLALPLLGGSAGACTYFAPAVVYVQPQPAIVAAVSYPPAVPAVAVTPAVAALPTLAPATISYLATLPYASQVAFLVRSYGFAIGNRLAVFHFGPRGVSRALVRGVTTPGAIRREIRNERAINRAVARTAAIRALGRRR